MDCPSPVAKSDWPDALRVEKRLPLCSGCLSRWQGQRTCEWVSPVDQMWVLQERDQLGGTVTPAQEGHMGGWRLEKQKVLFTVGGGGFAVTKTQQESLWETHTGIRDRKHPPAWHGELSRLILLLVREDHHPPAHWFLRHCSPPVVRKSSLLRGWNEQAASHPTFYLPKAETSLSTPQLRELARMLVWERRLVSEYSRKCDVLWWTGQSHFLIKVPSFSLKRL